MTRSLPQSTAPDFLSGLKPAETKAILAAAHKRKVARKFCFFVASEPSVNLYLLRSGRVKYFRTAKTGEEVLLQLLKPGDAFGVGSLLKQSPPYIASAEALSECELLIWSHTTIQQLSRVYPQLASNALRIVLHHLGSYVSRQVSLASKSAEQRLADGLIVLGDRSGQIGHDGIEIEGTNDLISSFANVSPFTVSRVVSKWKRAGYISRKRGRIIVHAPEALIKD